jgi:hypothetical protein
MHMVAHQGQKAPGGGTYAGFGTPTVARGGRVAFVALGADGTALYESGAGGARTATLLAATGSETGTRLAGCASAGTSCVFRGFDTPSAGPAGIAFHATLEQSHEAVFLIRGRCITALAATGDADPAGAKFRTFGGVGVAGDTVAFRAIIVGGTTPGGLYRASPPRGCSSAPAPLELLTPIGVTSALGRPLLAVGAPSGNRRGDVAVAADFTGGGATDAIVEFSE